MLSQCNGVVLTALVCSVVVAGATPLGFGAAAAAAPRTAVAATIVELTNAERAGAGRASLHTNARLMRAAQLHAEQMARARELAHVLPKAAYPRAEDRLAAAKYRWQTYGENVALGQPTAAAVVRSWMDSAGHRRNILNTEFAELGVGYATDRAGRPYYVQVFASPWSS